VVAPSGTGAGGPKEAWALAVIPKRAASTITKLTIDFFTTFVVLGFPAQGITVLAFLGIICHASFERIIPSNVL
jgi:hypothetical protein